MPPLNNFQKSCVAIAVSQALVIGNASATTIVVGDDPATDCTLVDAVESANTDTAVGNCSAGNGPDIIQFHNKEAVLSTPSYGSSALSVTSDITIEGKASNAETGSGTITRDTAGANLRLFSVASSGALTLKDVIVSEGRLEGCEGGAGITVQSGGELLLVNSTLTDNASIGDNTLGGAILASPGATVTLQYSSIEDNSAGNGGGIALINSTTDPATLVSENSTIVDNDVSNNGGGIWLGSGATASLTNTVLSSNVSASSGGAIFSQASSLMLENSSLLFNASYSAGGALASYDGVVTINKTTFFGNLATTNGGFASVHGDASLNISQSNFYGNSVGFYDRSATNQNSSLDPGQGGALFLNSSGSHTISNSTFSDNAASEGGAVYANQGALTLVNSTIVGGGRMPIPSSGQVGIAIDARNNASIRLDNTVIGFAGDGYRYDSTYGVGAAELAQSGRVLCVSSGAASISNGVSNLFQDNSCGAPATAQIGLSRLGASVEGQFTAGAGDDIESGLLGIQVYHTPVFNSPLLGAGDATVCGNSSTDQRDQARPAVGCDIGATQASFGTIVVDTTADNTSSTLANCSLRDALNTTSQGSYSYYGYSSLRANASCTQTFDNTDITFSESVFPRGGTRSIKLSDPLRVSSATVSIKGPGQSALIIDGDQGGLFYAQQAHLYLSDLTLSNGSGSRGTAILASSSRVALESVTVSSNTATRSAGAILMNGSNELLINNSTISGNSVMRDGAGGMSLSYGGIAIITNSTLSNNVSGDVASGSSPINTFGRQAGGLSVQDGGLAIVRNSTISGNSSAVTGGGIGVRNASLVLLNSTLSDNTADVSGAGIYVQQYENGSGEAYSADITLANSIVSGNRKGSGTNAVGTANYGNEIALASWERVTTGNYIAGAPLSLFNTNNVLGDSSATYAEAFASSANVASTLGLSSSLVATSTNVATNANPNSTALDRILAPLSNNGGPTLTHDLVDRSPAINAGNNGFCSGTAFSDFSLKALLLDQRGELRNDSTCDIGSIEYIDEASCFVAVTKADKAFTFCL